MLELKITAQMLDSAEPDIIGIKEAISNLIENWADVIEIDVRSSTPSQLSLVKKPEFRQEITVKKALEEIKKHSLTVKEMQNITQAFIEFTKLEVREEQ